MTYHSPPLELYEGHYPDAGCDCKGCIRDRGVEKWLHTFLRDTGKFSIPMPTIALGHEPGEGCDGTSCSSARVANGGVLPDDF